MCGRFTLTHEGFGDLIGMASVGAGPSQYALSRSGAAFRPRYNVAPSQEHWIVRLQVGGGDECLVIPASWGLHQRQWKQLRINARSESLSRVPGGLRELRRCVVPCDGFYEWVGVRTDRKPLWFHAADKRLLWMAGMYALTRDGFHRFAVVTCPANELVAQAHARMPVFLEEGDVPAWLSDDSSEEVLQSLLRPAPLGFLAVREVSTRVNRVAHDDESCLEPRETPQQMSLFAAAAG